MAVSSRCAYTAECASRRPITELADFRFPADISGKVLLVWVRSCFHVFVLVGGCSVLGGAPYCKCAMTIDRGIDGMASCRRWAGGASVWESCTEFRNLQYVGILF